MAFDHEQSPRLGQRTAVESTIVQIYAGENLPEAAWHGQMIYRSDTQELQVYDGLSEAWVDVVGGQFGQLTFVGPDEPVGQSVNDQWYDSDDGNHPYIWDGVDWISVRDQSIPADPSEGFSLHDVIQVDKGAQLNVLGEVVLAEGVTMPPKGPVLTDELVYSDTSLPAGTFFYGLTQKVASSTVFVTAGFGTDDHCLYEITRSNGAVTAITGKTWMDDYWMVGGIISVGSNYFVLGQDGNRGNDYYVYKLDTSYDKVDEGFFTSDTTIPQYPAIGRNGTSTTNFLIGYVASDSTTWRFRTHNTADAAYSGASNDMDGASGALSFVYCGRFEPSQADFGAVERWVMSTGHSTRPHYVFDSGENRYTAHEWTKGFTLAGMCWDITESRFYGLSNTGRIYSYSQNNTNTVYAANAWMDDDVPTTLTEISPVSSRVRKRRWYVRVTSDAPPQDGDPSTDAADAVMYYAGNSAGTLYQIGASTGPVWSKDIDIPPTSGTDPEGSNGFAGIAAPGRVVSTFEDGGSPVINFSGGEDDGRVGPYTWDAAAPSDTGWVDFTPLTGTGGFATTTITTAKYRRIGMMVWVRIQKNSIADINNAGNTTGAFSDVTIIGTGLPAAVLPSFTIEGRARFADSPTVVVLGTTGEVVRKGGYPRDYPSGSVFVAQFHYLLD